jgi:hypothetical protein
VKYVGYGALVASFWLLVATMRLVLHDDCQAVAPVAIESVSVAVPPPVPVSPKPYHDTDCQAFRLDGPRPRPVGHPISTVALVNGFTALHPQIHACYERFGVSGTAMVNVVIAKSGRVATADVTGKFAGTLTGACVEQVVKIARFPPSDGFSTPYPFQLK